MSTTYIRLSLRTLLGIDAATCATMGILLILAAGPLADLTAILQPVLYWAGIALLPVAAFMMFFARRHTVPSWASILVVLGNAGWVALSLALPVLGFIHPNPLGWAFLVAQSAVVALLAWLEATASRQETVSV